jgi:MFS transporter, DHA1 family, tetracycline resistance protein
LANKALRPEIRFLLFTLLVNAICFGIVVPVTPDLVMELGNVGTSEATAIGGWLALSYALFQFLFGPVIGNLSDRFGRRPVLLISLAGFVVEFAAMALAPTLAWLFFARILSGISGASNAPAQSAIADIAAPEDRARLFGLLSAAFGIGFVLGPAIGGILGEFGHRVPFYAAAVLTFGNFVYGLIACKETLKPENRRPFDWRRANPVGAFQQARKLPGIVPIAIVYFLWQLASLVYPLIWPYFVKARFDWSPGMIGLSLAQIGIGMALVNLFVNPRLLPKLGEVRTALVGLVCGTIGMFLYAAAPLSWMIFAIGMLMPLQSLVHPALTSMMSRHANATNQGEVQGFASSTMALGSVIAPVLFNPVQAWFTSDAAQVRFDGAALVVAGVIAIVAGVLLLAIRRREEGAVPV